MQRIRQLLKMTEQPAAGTMPPALPLSRLQQNRLHKRDQLLEQLDPRRCAQRGFSREPGAVAALARRLPLVQSRCLQGSHFWPSTQNYPNPEEALDRTQRRKVFFPRNLYKRASAEREASEIREMAELCGPIADVAINKDGLPTPTDTLASQVVATWIIIHLNTMPFSAGAALRTIRSATNGASIDEPKGLCSWQAPGIRAPAKAHSCRPAKAAASCPCCSSALGRRRRRRGLPEGTPRLPRPHGNDLLQLGLYQCG